MAIKIQLRRDTAANWSSNNPILAEGEIGVELDTKRVKVGDGSTHWNDLPYTFENYYVKIGETVANADKLDNQDGSYYTNANNLSAGIVPVERLNGTYNIDISGNADKVDNFDASQTPQANQIPVLNSGGQLSLPFAQTPILVNGQDMMSRTFYVDAENGDDNNDGSSSAPFKTIKKACDSVPVGGYGMIFLADNQTFELSSYILLYNKFIILKSDSQNHALVRNSSYIYNETYTDTTGFWLLNSVLVFRYVDTETSNLISGTNFHPNSGFIRQADYTSGCVYFDRNTNTLGDTDLVYLAGGRSFISINFYHSSISRNGQNRNAFVINIYDDCVFTFNTNSTDIGSLSWSDLVSGIIKDANGVPRNVISNIVF